MYAYAPNTHNLPCIYVPLHRAGPVLHLTNAQLGRRPVSCSLIILSMYPVLNTLLQDLQI